MPARASNVYEFGPFRLDVTERLLFRDSQPIRLRAKVFDTLCLLVENRGHLLTKDELMNAVWPDAAVEENNIAQNIAILRKALGQKATGERYIETVPARGYRFAGDVRVAGAETADAVLPPAPEFSDAPLFVHREMELRRLEQHLEAARGGNRQVVFVTGEAGIGKTTLVEAFAGRVKREHSIRVACGQCLEHRGAGEAYMPVLEALSGMCRQPGGESLIPLLSNCAPSWLVQMPWLVSSADLAAIGQKVVGATRERMLREMVEALERLTAERPLLLVLEDLQWADPSTLDLLSRLARRREPARLLVVGTYRPEGMIQNRPIHAATEELIARRHCFELPLSFLTVTGVRAYLQARFPGIALTADLPRLLHQRTDGNPLFVVEVVDSWVGQGYLSEVEGRWTVQAGVEEMAVGVPATLRNLIERSLEALGPEEQRVLEAASVIGREFPAAVVASADIRGEDAELCCAALARLGRFLRPHGTTEWPDGSVTAAYRFTHDLHRQVLYDRIPAGVRARLHQRIGARLEASYGSRAPEMASELAMHFIRGRDIPRAVRYLRLAAEGAIRRSAHQEAISQLAEGLELLERAGEVIERDRHELALLTALGPALIATKGWTDPEVEKTYVRARELCRRLGDPPEVFPILFGLAVAREFRGEFQESQALLEERLGLRAEEQNAGARLETHMLLACSLFHQGAFAPTVEHAERAVTLYDPQEHVALTAVYGENPGVACNDWAALALWFLGHPDQALERARAALDLAEDPGHLFSLASARTQAAMLYQLRREADQVRHWADAAITLASERGFRIHAVRSMILAGWALAVDGEREAGATLIRHGVDAYREAGAEMDRPYFLALLAEALAGGARVEEGLAAIAEALEMVRASRSFFYEAELYRLRGSLLMQAGIPNRLDEAEQNFLQAVDTARSQRSRSLELRAAMSLGRLWRFQGRRAEARRLIEEIYGGFTEGFDTPDLWQAFALLQAWREPGHVKAASYARALGV